MKIVRNGQEFELTKEEEAIRQVMEKYIARKVNEERGRRISKGKRKEVK